MTILHFAKRGEKPLRSCIECGIPLRHQPPAHRLCRQCHSYSSMTRAVSAHLAFLKAASE